MAEKKLLPLRYKFLLTQGFTLGLALVSFFFFASRIFYNDKKVFVRDLSLALLDVASSTMALQLRQRTDEIEKLLPSLSLPGTDRTVPLPTELPSRLRNELLQISFVRVTPNAAPTQLGSAVNQPLLTERNVPKAFLSSINSIPIRLPEANEGVLLYNRTPAEGNNAAEVIPVLTLVFPLTGEKSTKTFAVIDLDQNFVLRGLRRSDIAEIFLLTADGRLISHPNRELLGFYATRPYPHPILARVRDIASRSENQEVDIEGERFLCSYGNTGVAGLFVVSQIPRTEVFSAFSSLLRQALSSAAVIAYVTLLLSVILAAQLTSNLAKLRTAAERVRQGDFNFTVGLRSNDEVESVAESFDAMSAHIRELMIETADKARMEGELKTASLLQSTLLSMPEKAIQGLDMAWHYASATECSGDFWDASFNGTTLTLAIADATGHGVSAAIVTGVAKSCLSTMNSVYANQQIPPQEYLRQLNQVIYSSCRGKLLMTMCLIQLDVATGKMAIANAGHEFPLQFHGANPSTDKAMRSLEELVARGERLGFLADSVYTEATFQLESGDSLLVYTDGLSEGIDKHGKAWGERALKKAFAEVSSTFRQDRQAAQKIKQRLLGDFLSHTDGVAQADDVTFVVVRRNAA